MTISHDLWGEAISALAWHIPRKDASPLERIERLTKEHFPSIAQPINPETCNIWEEICSPDTIRSLKRWHLKSKPQRQGGRLVLFRHQGVYAIVDGNNRVNFWLAGDQVEPLASIVLGLRA